MRRVAAVIAAMSLITGPSPLHAATVDSGSLVKGSGPAVYYVMDGKRFAFPNEATYFTWYADFDSVRVITDADLAALPLGGNVTYRPGVKLLKLMTAPTVYAVAMAGTLRPLASEAVARALYGERWTDLLHDLPEAFFVNYTVGGPIATIADFSPGGETAAVPTIAANRTTGPLAPPQTVTLSVRAVPAGPQEISGRIMSIAVHPTNADIAYVGAASGGIFKTTDRGLTWRPVADHLSAMHVASLTIDPANPDLIYAGTGEIYAPGEEYGYDGLFVSRDAGVSWTKLAENATGGLPGAVSAIVIDPRDGAHLFAGSSSGVFESHDGGVSWKRLVEAYVQGLVMRAGDPNGLVASASNTQVFVTRDGGKVWTARAGFDIQSGLPDNNPWFTRLTLSESSGKTNLYGSPSVLYLVMTEPFRMYRSTDGGEYWHELGRLPFGGSARNYAVVAHPTDADTVYVAGTSLYRSTDGGYSFTTVNLPYFEVRAMSFAPSNPKVIYLATDTGMLVSSDGGYDWTPRNKGLAATQWHDAAIAADGTIYGAVQDHSLLRYRDGVFTQGFWGDAREVESDAVNASRIYARAPEKGIGRSTDHGASFAPINGDFMHTGMLRELTADPAASGTLFVAYGPSLYWSQDAGDRWYLLGSAGSSSNIVKIEVIAGTVFVARADGSAHAVSGFRTGAPAWRAATDHVFAAPEKDYYPATAAGLPSVPVTAVVTGKDGTTYVSTWGRGLYRIVR